MNSLPQFTDAGDGARLYAPDATLTVKVDSRHTEDAYELFEIDAPNGASTSSDRNAPTPLHRTGWGKTYYMLSGRILVQIEQQGYELGPGASVAIPPGALHTFTVLTPTARFLVFALTGGMGRFHADLDASVPHDRPLEESMADVLAVLGRHDVSMETEAVT